MTDKPTGILSQSDADRFSAKAKEYKKIVTASKEAAREALVRLGTHDANGNLTEQYRQPERP